MSRPIWSGVLAVGALRIPTQILGAGDAAAVSFNYAHRCKPGRFTRLQQKRWCPTCRKEIPHAAIARVYEHAPSQYLAITDDDLARCEAKASDALTITGVADAPRVSLLHIDTTTYLVPASDAAAGPLATFCAALGATRIAVGRLVLHKREQIVWLGSAGSNCVVYLLRTADHVATLLRASGPTVGTRHEHVTQLRQILAQLPRGEYALARDEYQHRVRQMLDTKIRTQATASLTDALKTRGRRSRKRR